MQIELQTSSKLANNYSGSIQGVAIRNEESSSRLDFERQAEDNGQALDLADPTQKNIEDQLLNVNSAQNATLKLQNSL